MSTQPTPTRPAPEAKPSWATYLAINSSTGALLGAILLQRGSAEEGLRYLREARLRQPANGEIRFHLAQALVKTGRNAEAKDELAAALVAPLPVHNSPELANLKHQLGL